MRKHLVFFLLLVSCSNRTLTITGGRPSASAEPNYCSTSVAYPSSFTVTGTAKYERRSFVVVTGLGTPDPTLYPIRYAEVRVINSAGSVIQCSETDGVGNFSVQLPTGSYTVQINSRSLNSRLKASVLTDPTTNQFYSISANASISSNTNLGTVVASATGTFVLGGAFNILDQLLNANEFLRNKTSASTTGCGSTFGSCIPFTVAPKALVYWKLGFNPNTYFGGSSGLSFYLPGYGELYILGGLNNDPNNTDTDHFDNAVIIHEYGHFIEDNYSVTNSPGGSHDGNSIIDPRLAWGEGWADFFGVAVNAWVTGDTRYRDTYGNVDGATKGYYFNYDVETNTPSRDVASFAGEGNFREFSIARTLLDVVDATNEGVDNISNSFEELWTIFTQDWKASTYHFRNYGLFMERHAALAGSSNYSVLLASEKQKPDRSDYATLDSGNVCAFTSGIVADTDDDGSFEGTNLFTSTDFYHYSHSGGPLTLGLSFNTSATNNDIDAYIYKENYVIGDTETIAASISSNLSSDTLTTSLPAGQYLINVVAWQTSSSTDYTLSINGDKVCP